MKTKYIIAAFALFGLLASCSTNMYVSNNVNVPLLKEKGEVKATLGENDIQLAAAVTDHIGVMVNGFSKTYEGKEYYEHKGCLGEAGLGYYTPIKNNFIFETYSGFGMGSVEKKVNYTNNEDQLITNSFNAHGERAFIQPGIGYSNKFFDLAFTPRFSFVKYTGFRSAGFSETELAADYLDHNRLTQGIFIFAEPALTLRGGYKYVKFQVQYGRTINLSRQEIRYCDHFGSIGLAFDFARRFKEKHR